MKQFNELKINDNIKAAIEELAFTEMTPIQEATLPTILEGKDIIAQAPTGTGKTACFAIPAIQLVDINNPKIQVMILCPTRELAMQVTDEVRKFASKTEGLRIITVYGGQEIEIQIRSLKKKPQIIVGTPGRIMDHMRRHTIDINEIKMLVLDEADEMLNMGFKEDLDVILKDVNPLRQTLLFSATMPDEIKRISKQYQKQAIFIKTTFDHTDLPNIKQYYVEIDESNKVNCLSRMIDTYNFKQALVFCRTKKKVDELSMALTSRKYQVECLHGDLRQAGREKVMDMFRNGLVRVLIATDVAARGLDIDGIDAVFNYDVPDDVEYYIHRIGRTARAGRDGASYTFVTRKEVNRIKEFMDKTKTEIVKVAPPTYREAEAKKVQHIIEDIMNLVTSNDMTVYQEYINTSLKNNEQNINTNDLAAGFLYQLIVSDSRFSDAGLDLENSKANKKARSKNNSRIFINLGRKDGLNVSKLVELICKKHLVSSDKVQGIDIMNTYSFFEIPNEQVEEVINNLKGDDYNGRRIDVEVSTGQKKDTEDSNKKPSRRRSDSQSPKRSQTSRSSKDYNKNNKNNNNDFQTESKTQYTTRKTTTTKTITNKEIIADSKTKRTVDSKPKTVKKETNITPSKVRKEKTTSSKPVQNDDYILTSKRRGRPRKEENTAVKGRRHQNKSEKEMTKKPKTKKEYINKSF